MSKKQMLDEGQILTRGIIKNIARTLDDGDDHAPAGHWFNTSGTRMYSLERVECAEQLIRDSTNGEYFHKSADYLNAQSTPCTSAIFIFDYRKLVEKIDRELAHNIWRERLSHPFAGRMPGSFSRECDFVETALIKIINFADPLARISSKKNLFSYFESISGQARKQLKAPWPDVVLRKPQLKYNVSKGVGVPSAKKIINIFSLIHCGIVSHELIGPADMDLIQLLASCPVIRVDHKIKKR